MNDKTEMVAGRLELVIKVSRIASGPPADGEWEYADEMTLGRAFEGRRFYYN